MNLPLELGGNEKGLNGLEEMEFNMCFVALDDLVGNDKRVSLAEFLKHLGEELIFFLVLMEKAKEVVGSIFPEIFEKLFEQRVINGI